MAPPNAGSAISIPVSPDVAAAFRALPVEKQEALKDIFRYRIERAVQRDPEEVVRQFDELRQEARQAGLTEELLDQILKES